MQTLFGRKAPVVFEIGFGNGASLIEMAIHQLENDFIGVEVHRPGVGQLLKAIEENNLTNVRVACTDAVELLKNQVADNALHRVQLYFPDPWHKNVIINVELSSQLLLTSWHKNSGGRFSAYGNRLAGLCRTNVAGSVGKS